MQLTSWQVLFAGLSMLLTGCKTASFEDMELDAQTKVLIKQIWAAEREDVELPCDLVPSTNKKDTVSMVLWFKDDASIPLYNLDARGGDIYNAVHWTMSGSLGNRTYFQVDNGNGLARLKVKNVTYEDQGVFRCRVDFANSPTRNTRVNLTLIEPPTTPVIYDAQGREVKGVGGPFLEGYDLLLTCQVSGGKPKPSVTWWQDNNLLDDIMEVPMVIGSTSKFTENRLFINNVTRFLWGSKLECRAESRMLKASKVMVRKVPLDIYLKPAVVSIIFNQDQIYAEQPITVRCETWGSSPAARIVWRLGGILIRESSLTTTHRINSTASKMALVLDKDDDGKELTCRAENPRFPGGVLEKTKVLRVHYAPIAFVELAVGFNIDTLREGDDVKFICNYQSNPEPTSIEWLHNNKRLDHSVEEGVLIASRTLTLRVLMLKHNGTYSCIVRNAVGETESPPLTINMKYAPRCKSNHEKQDITIGLKKTLKIFCEIDANPLDSVRFSWTHNTSLGDVSALSNSRRVVNSLEYTVKSNAEFGTLACWASNSIGRQKTPCIFNIIPAKPPQKPIDCNIHNDTRAMEVNCLPGSSGGLPQYFLLEVRGILENSGIFQQIPQSDQAAGEDVPPIFYDRSEQPNFQLYGLLPGYDYTIAIYAENSQGRSKPVLIENVRVTEPTHKNPAESEFLGDLSSVMPRTENIESVLVFIGLIVAVVLILVGIGVVIGLAVCRKQTSLPQNESVDDFTTPTYVSAQRVEPRIRYGKEKRRSQRTSLYMEECRNEPDLLQQVDIDLHD